MSFVYKILNGFVIAFNARVHLLYIAISISFTVFEDNKMSNNGF